MNRFLLLLFAVSFFSGCKSNKSKPDIPAANFFPVKPYIKGQLAQFDTSSLTFYKIQISDDHSDTTIIKNTEVKKYAADFINMPDISDPGLKNDYAIDHLYDDILDAFVFTFTTKEPHALKREDVVLDPKMNEQGKNDIKSIFVQIDEMNKDTAVQKNLFWEAGRSFKTTTTFSKLQTPDKTQTIQIFWNEAIPIKK